MSRQALEWVRRLTHTAAGRRLAAVERRALDELAWRHDEDRRRVAPKMAEFAAALPVSERTAQRLLRRLEADGILAAEPSSSQAGGRALARAYRFVGLDGANHGNSGHCLPNNNGDILSPLPNDNGDNLSPFSPRKGDRLSPFSGSLFPPHPLSPCEGKTHRTQKQKHGRPAAARVRDEGLRERFERLWASYPVHEKRRRAEAVWAKLAPGEELLAAMLQAVEWQRGTKRWREGFVPHLSTWLNDRRWEDEPEPAAPSGGGWVPSDGCLDYLRERMEAEGARPSETEVWAEAMRRGMAWWMGVLQEQGRGGA